MKQFSQILLILGLFGFIQQANAQCVDPSLINSIPICPLILDPVCGCNGVTYDNECLATTLGGVTSSTPGECQAGGGCVDQSLINPNAICAAIYLPVCGCNGVTYGNECEATNFGGVTSWTPGECGAEPVCSVDMEDSLLLTFDLRLNATNPAGVAPFTYSWNIQGAGGGSINPIYTSTNSDTIVIGSVDLFNNFSCVIVNLCMTDAVGCFTCMTDTSYGNGDMMCFSGFTWDETDSAGVFMITPSAMMPPAFLYQGMNMNWGESGQQQEVFPGQSYEIVYTPTAYNAAGYDFQACVITYLVSGLCIDCQTLHASPGAFPNATDELDPAAFSVKPNPSDAFFIVETDQISDLTYTMTDLTGRPIQTGTLYQARTRIETETLPTGMYLFQIADQEGRTTTLKIMVK
jgi:Secretion system C-terminal sorting domain/Kazal-type serine protease inhibitor domain